MLWRILRWLSLPLLACSAIGWGLAFYHVVFQKGIAFNSGLFHVENPYLLGLPLGFCFRATLAFLMARLNRDNPFAFIDTLEHELTHALFGYLTLQPPVSLRASLDGDGEVLLKGQNPLNLLAPYFFPFFAWIAAGLTLVMDAHWHPFGVGISLGLLGSFLFRLGAEYRWRQTDLHPYGFLFSTLVVFNFLSLNLGLFFATLKLLPSRWMLNVPLQAKWVAGWSGSHLIPWLHQIMGR